MVLPKFCRVRVWLCFAMASSCSLLAGAMRLSNFRRRADFCSGSLLNVSTNDMIEDEILMEYGCEIVNGDEVVIGYW